MNAPLNRPTLAEALRAATLDMPDTQATVQVRYLMNAAADLLDMDFQVVPTIDMDAEKRVADAEHRHAVAEKERDEARATVEMLRDQVDKLRADIDAYADALGAGIEHYEILLAIKDLRARAERAERDALGQRRLHSEAIGRLCDVAAKLKCVETLDRMKFAQVILDAWKKPEPTIENRMTAMTMADAVIAEIRRQIGGAK